MVQVAFLTYRLPALACAPPLLLRLIRQHSPKGTLLLVEIVASPNLPGQLSGVKLALNVPSAVSSPAKVRPELAAQHPNPVSACSSFTCRSSCPLHSQGRASP